MYDGRVLLRALDSAPPLVFAPAGLAPSSVFVLAPAAPAALPIPGQIKSALKSKSSAIPPSSPRRYPSSVCFARADGGGGGGGGASVLVSVMCSAGCSGMGTDSGDTGV